MSEEKWQDKLFRIVGEYQIAGFYDYEHWLVLNQKMFRLSALPFVVQFWRILRIVSAEKIVTTELISQSLLQIIELNKSVTCVTEKLKQIFVEQMDGKGLKILNAQKLSDLCFLRRIRTVVIDYRNAILRLVQGQTVQQPELSRFDYMYEYGKAMLYRKSLKAVQLMQQEAESCTFRPRTNPYQLKAPRKPLYQSKVATQESLQNSIELCQEEQKQQFKARQMPDFSRYQAHSRALSFSQKINLSQSTVSSTIVKQPATTSRKQQAYIANNLTKKNKFLKTTPLFKIKVGLREYEVRQGVTAKELAKTIQLAEGRKDNTLESQLRLMLHSHAISSKQT